MDPAYVDRFIQELKLEFEVLQRQEQELQQKLKATFKDKELYEVKLSDEQIASLKQKAQQEGQMRAEYLKQKFKDEDPQLAAFAQKYDIFKVD